jgi:hypothetical protein
VYLEPRGWPSRTRAVALVLVVVALTTFYYRAAAEHGRRVNVSRVRADQSGYLWDAVGIYQMRHGGQEALIGERNRMPVYPWLLSWLYSPAYSPDEFFAVVKRWNIRLSLVLLVIIAAIAVRSLPALPATNLILIAAFGYFVFKAAYAQVELLFYTIWFVMFLGCLRALTATTPASILAWTSTAAALAALAHLSKAAVLPFASVFLVAMSGRAAVIVAMWWRMRGRVTHPLAVALGPALFAVVFLAILSPYLINSKRVFGHYFYNVNSTFYVWYDDWPSASQGTYSHGDGVGWPKMPTGDIPTMRKYVREHSVTQIAARIGDGLREMVTVSYIRLWYFKWVAFYIALAALVAWTRRLEFHALLRTHPTLVAFLSVYAAVYLLAVAFYKPISGTTLRMLLTHVLPLLFVLLYFLSRVPFRDTRWEIAGQVITVTHLHLLVLATIAMDSVFTLWPRVMSEFAGY